MTRLGLSAGLAGVALTVVGWRASWLAVFSLGAGFVVLFVGSGAYVVRRPRLAVQRAIYPPRVEKGQPAIAVVEATNLSRRSLPPLSIEQRLGMTTVRAALPRLRRGETGLRTYRLPTSRRGIYDIGPVEVGRSDPFGLCRTVQRLGEPQRIAVHPRLLRLRPLPTGASRNLEGPSSDTSPQGSVSFHRLREYAVGDDLRTVHWPSTARLGQLVVRHNVDTAQPYTVTLLDLRPEVYSQETFEEAVDVTASVLASMSEGKAPVQLRTTGGDRLGGPGRTDLRPLIDFLTEVGPREAGSLNAELLMLRRERGGAALVVITGRIDALTSSATAGLCRRFDRVLLLSVRSRPRWPSVQPGVTVLVASNAGGIARAWNNQVAR